jgi:secondary thiamine-phosphate synthase enzyme
MSGMCRVYSARAQVPTQGNDQMIDLTSIVRKAIVESGFRVGIVTIFVAHSTAGVTISEYEPGLIEDVKQVGERIAPAGCNYLHDRLNYDDNAHSHLRALVLGPSVTVPFENGEMLLGTWQRVVLIDFDTHPRTRNVVIQVLGE